MFAAGLRFVRLGEPDKIVFDEVYYAKDACLYLDLGQKFCGLTQATEQSYVHPPTGKWLIAAGIKLFGYNFFGQRFMAAVFGVGLVALVFLLAGRLFRNQWISTVSGFLVATDFLLIVQSRTAMLDIFLAFFVVLGFLFLAIDRDRILLLRAHLRDDGPGPVPKRGLAWRCAAGAAFGVALSIKWSAVYALAGAGLLSIAWSYGLWKVRKRSGRPVSGDRRPAALKGLAAAGLAFGLLPLVVYLASYFDYYLQRSQADCAYEVPAASEDRIYRAGKAGLTEGQCVGGFRGVQLSFVDLHQRMAEYHLTLKATHPYQSKAWSWPLVLRPVAYHWEWQPEEEVVAGTERKVAHINAMGNVLTWYGALVAGGWLVIRSARKWRAETVVAAAWASQYVPWLLVPRPLFFFYMTPAVPFMMIGLAAGLHALGRDGGWMRWSVGAFLFLTTVMLIIFYPVLTAIGIPYDVWRLLMWMRSFTCGGLKCGWI